MAWLGLASKLYFCQKRRMAGDTAQNKTNILFLISDMQGGGAQRVASLLCNAWVERGDQVTLVTYEPEGTDAFYALSDEIIWKKLDLFTGSTNIFLALWSNLKRITRLQKIMRDTKPDVVLCFGAEVTVIGVMAGLGLDFKIIGCERSDPAVYPIGIWAKLRNFAYPKVTKLVVQTPNAAEFCNQFQNDVSIVPNPIVTPNITKESDITAPERSFIASMGRFSHEKGHDILIHAFAKIADQHKNLDLLLIGDGPKRSEYEQLSDDLGLKARIHFSGRSQNPFPVLAQAKVFILPSRFEGFPNALAESMTLGLPCISTLDAIGARALIDQGRNGVLIEGDNPSVMADAISQILNDEELAIKLSGEAKKIADVLSLENNLKLWDKVMCS